MDRPKIKLKLDKKDLAIIALTVLSVLVNFIIVFYYYPQLPNEIAHHFNGAGKPDSYGNKSFIISLPIIATLLSLFLIALCKIPESFNYLVEITEENAKLHYTLATKMMRFIALAISLLFLDLTYQTISVGLKIREELSVISVLLFLVLISVVLGVYIAKSRKIK